MEVSIERYRRRRMGIFVHRRMSREWIMIIVVIVMVVVER